MKEIATKKCCRPFNPLTCTYPICLPGILSDPEDLKRYIVQDELKGPTCGICFSFSHRSKSNVQNHIESKHFPNSFTYTCPKCFKNVSTKKALEIHNNRCKVWTIITWFWTIHDIVIIKIWNKWKCGLFWQFLTADVWKLKKSHKILTCSWHGHSSRRIKKLKWFSMMNIKK